MEIKSDNPEHGFQFPGTFEITAMGPATAGLEVEIPKLLTASGINVLHESISWRGSSGGKFVSVKLSFRADDRAPCEAAHAARRAAPAGNRTRRHRGHRAPAHNGRPQRGGRRG